METPVREDNSELPDLIAFKGHFLEGAPQSQQGDLVDPEIVLQQIEELKKKRRSEKQLSPELK